MPDVVSPDRTAEVESTVCLTFDFDALSLWFARGMTSPGPLSRGEFGAHAVPRLLRLLERYSIPTTWFVPGHTADTYPDLCRRIFDAGHEIAMHGYLHEPVSALGPGEERAVLARAHKALTRITGVDPVGNRTPSWDYTDDTVQSLLDLGLRYDSSLMATDYTPYFCRTGDRAEPDGYRFGEPTALVQLPVSWSLDDYPQFEYLRTADIVLPGLRSPREVFGNFLDDVRYMTREEPGGVCVITFHPQVIGRGHRMIGLEWFLDELVAHPVRFSRCDAVADDFAARSAPAPGAPGHDDVLG
jgi:peptidoglycan/xylan/chitin deacetylase (PgdA/CDA1 family)